MPLVDPRSLKNLQGVHPDLVKVAHHGFELSAVPFIVTEGVRTIERQRQRIDRFRARLEKRIQNTVRYLDLTGGGLTDRLAALAAPATCARRPPLPAGIRRPPRYFSAIAATRLTRLPRLFARSTL